MEDYAFPKCSTMKRITYKSKIISYDFEAAPSRGNWVYQSHRNLVASRCVET